MVQYYQNNKNQKISTIDTNSLQHLCTIEDPKQKGKQSKKQKQEPNQLLELFKVKYLLIQSQLLSIKNQIDQFKGNQFKIS